MHYLITGSSGFIGSRLLERLFKEKRNIKILGRKNIIKRNINFFKYDLRNNNIPKEAFINVDTVVHCAGIAHDTESKLYLASDYNLINFISTMRLAKLASEQGVNNFIYISSVKAAPFRENIPNDETSVSEPEDEYGYSKRNSENALLELQKSINMSIIIIRPALVYGDDVAGNLRNMIEKIDKNFFPPIPRIENKRSMVHIDYLIDFILNITQYKNTKGQIFIIADKKTYTITEIYDSIYYNLKNKRKKFALPHTLFFAMSIIGDVFNKFFYFPFNSNIYKKLFSDDYYSTQKSEKYIFSNKDYDLNSSMKSIIYSYKKNKAK